MSDTVNIKNLLAEHIGVDPSEIKNEDLLKDDLHMSSADLTDFSEKLKKHDISADLDFQVIQTVGDLVEELILEIK